MVKIRPTQGQRTATVMRDPDVWIVKMEQARDNALPLCLVKLMSGCHNETSLRQRLPL